MSRSLGDLQQLTMLSVARLDERAFGGAIRDELERVAGRAVAISTVYVTLVRLENDGLVSSLREQRSSNGRGGRPRRFFELTSRGRDALRASRAASDRMWEGLELESR